MVNAYKNRIIAEIEPDDFVEVNGLYIPTKAKSREYLKVGNTRTIDENYTNHIREGTVTSVGPEAKDLAVGQHIIFNRHNGEEFEIDGRNYISIVWNDILTIVS